MVKNGTVIARKIVSKKLRSNPLRDPFIRDILIYLPPDYTSSNSNGYLTIIGLPSFGSNAKTWLNEDPFKENMKQKIDRLILSKSIIPIIYVVVDCFTKLGGNQYINSTATGNYEDFIIQEVVPFIKNEYNASSLIVMGKSSGGYGAFSLAGNNHTVFQGFVSHSGDCGFEYCYFPDFPAAIETLRSSGNVKNWLKTFWSNAYHDRSKSSQMKTLNIVAMSAHYSPNPRSENGFDLPFNFHTGEIIDKVWKKWQSKDPVRVVDILKSKLLQLKYVYIDCGVNDEFNLQLGNRALHYKLKNLGIKHYYEEFDGGHFNTSHRFDRSLELASKIFR